MTQGFSLRSRLLLGAALWTAGFFILTGLVMTQVMLSHPSAPRLFHGFFSHIPILSGIAVICLVAGLQQFRKGLSSMDELRARLGAVHEGRESRVQGNFPVEVSPLVRDLNALLDQREQTVRRAQAKAGDLAHGLKTPLAVLAQEAERAEADGHIELASHIHQQIDRMRRQVDYHLAQARASAAGAGSGARCDVAESAEALARTLRRLYAERGVRLTIDVPAGQTVPLQREDLDEMLGNLLDNACKWARSAVVVSSEASDARVTIFVDDDGPGLEASKREAVLQRGVRADQAAPGSGFGLAIVRDLADLYGGTIALDQAPIGGVRAKLDLPGVKHRPPPA